MPTPESPPKDKNDGIRAEELPLLRRPAAPAASSSDALRELRRFHFAPGAAVVEGFAPFLTTAAAFRDPYPLFLGPPETADGALGVPLPDLLARSELGDVEAAGGRFLPYGDDVPLRLLCHAAAARTLPAWNVFREEARVLVEQARRLLGEAARPAADGAAEHGELGDRFFDPAALEGLRRTAATPPAASGHDELAADLAALEAFLAGGRPPLPVLCHDGRHGVSLPGADELKTIERDDPCAAAAELFDERAASAARVLRAVHRLRLAVAGDYDPERHDPWLEQLDWQAFSREELALLAPVAALVRAEQVARGEMASLSCLLLSGRPVQVLVLAPPAAWPGAADEDPFSGFRFEAAYLGLSHREAFVQQTAAARPLHMLRGFQRALASPRAALHVIAAPRTAAAELLAVAARAHPLFQYDPEAGASWADRLDFAGNPEPADDWPRHELRARREGGGEETLDLFFTFADYALAEPAYARHFLPLPEGVPESALATMAEHCRAPAGEPGAIPYVWGRDGASLCRLAVSRPLALACRDRLGFWRALQEMAGTRSEHARRAAEQARREAEARAGEERARLETLHAGELERLRREALRDVVDRLTAALLATDAADLAVPEATPASLPALAGRGVDEVTARLLALVGSAPLDGDEPAAGDERVDRVASELLRALAGGA